MSVSIIGSRGGHGLERHGMGCLRFANDDGTFLGGVRGRCRSVTKSGRASSFFFLVDNLPHHNVHNSRGAVMPPRITEYCGVESVELGRKLHPVWLLLIISQPLILLHHSTVQYDLLST